MPESDSTPPLASLAIDVPCISCGYNLRTLSVSGDCPECGHTVRETLENPLVACSSESLVSLRIVAGMLIYAKPVLLVSPLLFFFGPCILGVVVPSAIGELALSCGFAALAWEAAPVKPRYRRVVFVASVLLVLVALSVPLTGDAVVPVTLAVLTTIIILPMWVAGNARQVAVHGGYHELSVLALSVVQLGYVALSVATGVPLVSLPFVEFLWPYTPAGLLEAVADVLIAVSIGVTPFIWILCVILLVRLRRMLKRVIPIAQQLQGGAPATETHE
ncbi:MAG: hypothetical protein JSU63_21055 [Phycisphaerales bacterium]|nr:MAG: hypothetical protein JSU63_21055 [Phycisphaerales bacterium]